MMWHIKIKRNNYKGITEYILILIKRFKTENKNNIDIGLILHYNNTV
jgi:hypothetical protein